MIIVMIVVVVLGVLVGGFAYSMKVEMTLARNTTRQADLKWLGRSGVELASYVLGQQAALSQEPYDALNQIWAGGPGNITNQFLSNISLKNHRVGPGEVSVEITDMERKFNINLANEMILQQAMAVVGVDVAESSGIINSILDWRDPDEETRVGGREDYTQASPGYHTKNGPIDHMNELLWVQGVTPAIYWGSQAYDRNMPPPGSNAADQGLQSERRRSFAVGLEELFTPISGHFINVNTASADVLQLIPTIGENVAQEIVRRRAGPDLQAGTRDDMPYRSIAELPVPWGSSQQTEQLKKLLSVRSVHFKVEVTARLGGVTEEYVALLRRSNSQNIHILYMHEK